MAFKRGCFYAGYKRAAPISTPNFVQETLSYIKEEVMSLNNLGKTVLYSPGICSVPYLVEIANLIYLPSQLLLSVNSLNELASILQIACAQGYECYAVLGYDPFIKDRLCAWIKFIELPKEYITLI